MVTNPSAWFGTFLVVMSVFSIDMVSKLFKQDELKFDPVIKQL
jgi:hypothetical protein